MASSSARFELLKAAISDLSEVYLPIMASAFVPASAEQEKARAFILLAHAEFEFFVEEACREKAGQLFRSAQAGVVDLATLCFLSFSAIPPINGGEGLGSGRATSRKLLSRLGDASSKYTQSIESNEGIREKHLAKLLVPLGVSEDNVDRAWLNDIEALCTLRGQLAHISRSDPRASPGRMNPSDIRALVARIVSTDPRLAVAGRIASFEDLDAWLCNAPPAVVQRSWWSRITGSGRR